MSQILSKYAYHNKLFSHIVFYEKRVTMPRTLQLYKTYVRSAEAAVVAGRPGQRRSRQAVPGACAACRPFYVRSVIARPLRVKYHPLLDRIERCPFFGLSAQLTRGEPPPSYVRTRPRPLHSSCRSYHSCRSIRTGQTTGQTARETRAIFFYQTRREQEVR